MRVMGEEIRLSPSQAFKYGIGINLYYGFRIGMMRGSIMVIERKRSKYRLINRITVSGYVPFGPDRLIQIKEYYDSWNW